FVFLLFFNLSYATYKLPEGTNCDHFCQSNSSVIPNEITGIYYMTEMVPFPFDVGINCGYLNISEPVDGLQYFEEIVKKCDCVSIMQRLWIFYKISVYVYSRVAVPKCEDIGPVMESLYNCGIPPEAFTVMDYSKCLRC
ncbi:CLUMA_CG014913, isoform A, partial [Clunio marinus]